MFCDLHTFTEVKTSSLLSFTYYKLKPTNKNKKYFHNCLLYGCLWQCFQNVKAKEPAEVKRMIFLLSYSMWRVKINLRVWIENKQWRLSGSLPSRETANKVGRLFLYWPFYITSQLAQCKIKISNSEKVWEEQLEKWINANEVQQ